VDIDFRLPQPWHVELAKHGAADVPVPPRCRRPRPMRRHRRRQLATSLTLLPVAIRLVTRSRNPKPKHSSNLPTRNCSGPRRDTIVECSVGGWNVREAGDLVRR
jgi:hypothetical protein